MARLQVKLFLYCNNHKLVRFGMDADERFEDAEEQLGIEIQQCRDMILEHGPKPELIAKLKKAQCEMDKMKSAWMAIQMMKVTCEVLDKV